MGCHFHAAAQAADDIGRDYEHQYGKVHCDIDIRPCAGLTTLVVGQALEHTDPDFAWTALWVLRSCGHRLHIQDRLRQPTNAAEAWLHAGAVVAFDTRLPHWTEKGRGALVAAAVEFADEPTPDQVHDKFGQHIQSCGVSGMRSDRDLLAAEFDAVDGGKLTRVYAELARRGEGKLITCALRAMAKARMHE